MAPSEGRQADGFEAAHGIRSPVSVVAGDIKTGVGVRFVTGTLRNPSSSLWTARGSAPRDEVCRVTDLEVAMRVKTICFSFLAGLLLAQARPAMAGVPDEVRQDFARAVYSGSPELVHNRHPQPLLRAVVVLNVKLDEAGNWTPEVVRTNDEQPEMLARALETVRRAPPIRLTDDARVELRRNGFMEAWLFDNDGTFQVKTLAKAQRSGL